MENTLSASVTAAVAAEVRAEMARQRLSKDRLANALGWERNYLSRRVEGRVAFGVGELAEVATELDVLVTQFLPQASTRHVPDAIAAHSAAGE